MTEGIYRVARAVLTRGDQEPHAPPTSPPLRLVANFPVFAQGIQERLTQAQSLHVGVVTTDDYGSNTTGCGEIGNLVAKTAGPSSSNAECGPFTSGAAFIDQTEPDLPGRFAPGPRAARSPTARWTRRWRRAA